MRYIFHNFKKGIQFALYIVIISEILLEIWYQGVTSSTDWRVMKLLAGSFIVCLGYSLSSGIYLIKQIPIWLKVIIQLVIGSLFFIGAGYLYSWFTPDNFTYNLFVIVGQLLIAIAYLLMDYLYNAKIASEIKKHLKS